MTAYIVDTHNMTIANTYPDASYASYAMSDNYGWEPDNRYQMFRDEDDLFDYWNLCGYESGEFYEYPGYSFDQKVDMFKDWLQDQLWVGAPTKSWFNGIQAVNPNTPLEIRR